MIEMFETDIRVAALDGVKLHQKDGTPFWKLAFKCKGCGNLSDDCFCYTTKEAMEKDREEYKDDYWCSLSCQVRAKTPEEQRDWVNGWRRYFRKHHKPIPFVKWWDINEVIEFLEDWFSGEDMWYPENSDMECPL